MVCGMRKRGKEEWKIGHKQWQKVCCGVMAPLIFIHEVCKTVLNTILDCICLPAVIAEVVCEEDFGKK
jgi:hypothetical protein